MQAVASAGQSTQVSALVGVLARVKASCFDYTLLIDHEE